MRKNIIDRAAAEMGIPKWILEHIARYPSGAVHPRFDNLDLELLDYMDNGQRIRAELENGEDF